jgi:hypothetical protein
LEILDFRLKVRACGVFFATFAESLAAFAVKGLNRKERKGNPQSSQRTLI